MSSIDDPVTGLSSLSLCARKHRSRVESSLTGSDRVFCRALNEASLLPLYLRGHSLLGPMTDGLQRSTSKATHRGSQKVLDIPVKSQGWYLTGRRFVPSDSMTSCEKLIQALSLSREASNVFPWMRSYRAFA